MLAVDLGSRTTKAVHLERRGEGFALCRYAVLDAPIFEKTLSADLLAEHLRAVSQALDAKTKAVALTVGVNDALVRHVDMPLIPVEDMRLVLKHNSRGYLQQELMANRSNPPKVPPASKNRRSSSPVPKNNSWTITCKAPGPPV
jgi:Tfp pilus assembly PilM family ATPase